MIYVNGAEQPLKEQMTISDFLKKHNYQAERVAVELNGSIVPRSLYYSTILKTQDKLEIVCFVGGG